MSFADWLALREPADAAARSTELVDRLAVGPGAEVHDLGSGTGAMMRWLAPRLPTPHRWVLYDRDPDLLARAGVAQTRRRDVTRLTRADLAGASLVTASALLDTLTAAEVDRVAGACAGRPALLTLTVVGRVELSPADPLDAELAAAFDDHQRRGGRLGPDAVGAAVAAFERRGARVELRPSPWLLGPGPLADEWLRGWVAAAVEQRPELAPAARAYRDRRLADGFRVVVGHSDLLAG